MSSTHIFSDKSKLADIFNAAKVVIVGSGPGCLDNEEGFIDSHDVVVRVNNHKLTPATGFRTDAHYSFYGTSITKTAEQLKSEGVQVCLCKCPDEKFMESEWHRRMNKPHGVDFRYIYEARKNWWFCPTYIPSREEFVQTFDMLDRHIPSTGFSALMLINSLEPSSIHLTGFDFFASRIHNTNEPWRPGNPDDPIGHAPELEAAWLRANKKRFTLDKRLQGIIG